ncbi:MAG: lamin tail domain-containing protein, partial [Thermoguttaceae bacterium]
MATKRRRGAPGARHLSAARRRPAATRFWQQRFLSLEHLEPRRLLSLSPIISEIDPANKTGIVDAAGVASDWLEIYNPDPQQAVSLNGWSLNYAKTNATWTFPNNVTLGPGEFRVIFCDSTPTTDPVGELHTNFNLSKSGSTVELINGSDAVVSSLTYPALSSDTSYGPAETVSETKLVAAGATATYYTPTSNLLGTTWTQPGFNDGTGSGWASGPTGLGFANSVNGFAATLYRANVSGTIGSVETAQTIINPSTTPLEYTSKTSQTESVLNFMDTGGGG